MSLGKKEQGEFYLFIFFLMSLVLVLYDFQEGLEEAGIISELLAIPVRWKLQSWAGDIFCEKISSPQRKGSL